MKTLQKLQPWVYKTSNLPTIEEHFSTHVIIFTGRGKAKVKIVKSGIGHNSFIKYNILTNKRLQLVLRDSNHGNANGRGFAEVQARFYGKLIEYFAEFLYPLILTNSWPKDWQITFLKVVAKPRLKKVGKVKLDLTLEMNTLFRFCVHNDV